ncbi:MAG: hypothetical protein SNJ75_12715, partial [Gemmataceae bacterium]
MPCLRSVYRRPLRLEALEDRLTPTFNISIESIAATTGFEIVHSASQVTYTANATGATLNLDDVYAELQAGKDVIISTGVGGGEDGEVTWFDNFDFDGISGSRTLTIEAAGRLSVFGSISDSEPLTPDSFGIQIQAGGDVNLGGLLGNLSQLTVNAGSKTVDLSVLADINGTVEITAGTIYLNNSISFASGDLILRGNVELYNGLEDIEINLNSTLGLPAGNLTFTGTLNAPLGDGLYISAGNTSFGGVIGGFDRLAFLTVVGNSRFEASANTLSLVGSATFTGDVVFDSNFTVNFSSTSESITFSGSLTEVGSNSFTTNGTLRILSSTNDAVLAVSGNVSANHVRIESGGVLAPGGIGTSPTTMNITADVSFIGSGRLHLDLDEEADDQLNITGNLSLGSGSQLDSSGSPGSGSRVLVMANSITGNFGNAPDGQGVVMSMDAFLTTYTTTQISIERAPDGPSTVVGATADGSIYTVRLLGPTTARLVVVPNPTDLGRFDVVIRNAAPTTSLSITVQPNGGLGQVQLGALRVNGPLAALNAPRVDLAGKAIVTGLLGSAHLRDMTSGSSLKAGGLATQTTSMIRSRTITHLEVGSRIGTLTTQRAGDPFGGSQIAAAGINTLQVSGSLSANLRLSPPSSTATALGKASLGWLVECERTPRLLPGH